MELHRVLSLLDIFWRFCCLCYIVYLRNMMFVSLVDLEIMSGILPLCNFDENPHPCGQKG